MGNSLPRVMPWVLIDSSWIGHRARCSIKGLDHDDQPTGVIFGLLHQTIALCNDARILSNKVAFCYDSKKSIRAGYFPEYKRHRITNRDADEIESIRIMHEQLDRLRKEILPECGFRVLLQSGLESDDVMAQAAVQLENQGRDLQAVMITADNDLYQCIKDNVHWYDPSRNKYYDPHDLWKAKGVYPHQWLSVKALAGCHGDNIPGVGGVAEKSAIDYVLGDLRKGARYEACRDGAEIIKRNMSLVRLPHKKTQPVDLTEPTYNPREFYRWMKRLGMRQQIEGRNRVYWDGFFNGALESGADRIRDIATVRK